MPSEWCHLTMCVSAVVLLNTKNTRRKTHTIKTKVSTFASKMSEIDYLRLVRVCQITENSIPETPKASWCLSGKLHSQTMSGFFVAIFLFFIIIFIPSPLLS